MMGPIKLFGPLVTFVARLRVSVQSKLRQTGFFLVAVLLLGTSPA